MMKRTFIFVITIIALTSCNIKEKKNIDNKYFDLFKGYWFLVEDYEAGSKYFEDYINAQIAMEKDTNFMNIGMVEGMVIFERPNGEHTLRTIDCSYSGFTQFGDALYIDFYGDITYSEENDDIYMTANNYLHHNFVTRIKYFDPKYLVVETLKGQTKYFVFRRAPDLEQIQNSLYENILHVQDRLWYANRRTFAYPDEATSINDTTFNPFIVKIKNYDSIMPPAEQYPPIFHKTSIRLDIFLPNTEINEESPYGSYQAAFRYLTDNLLNYSIKDTTYLKFINKNYMSSKNPPINEFPAQEVYFLVPNDLSTDSIVLSGEVIKDDLPVTMSYYFKAIKND